MKHKLIMESWRKFINEQGTDKDGNPVTIGSARELSNNESQIDETSQWLREFMAHLTVPGIEDKKAKDFTDGGTWLQKYPKLFLVKKEIEKLEKQFYDDAVGSQIRTPMLDYHVTTSLKILIQDAIREGQGSGRSRFIPNGLGTINDDAMAGTVLGLAAKICSAEQDQKAGWQLPKTEVTPKNTATRILEYIKLYKDKGGKVFLDRFSTAH